MSFDSIWALSSTGSEDAKRTERNEHANRTIEPRTSPGARGPHGRPLWTSKGGDDYGWGTVSTKDQTLTASAQLGVYKLMQGDQSRTKDDYPRGGRCLSRHPGRYRRTRAANWVSVGSMQIT